VLVVDDNRDAAATLGMLLELDGHTVRLAHDGPTAVAEAKEWQPDLILMDLGLPGFSGLEAARQIRSSASATRPIIIALTGWGTDLDRVATQEAGCDLHLVKPVAHEVLRRAFEAVTDKVSSQ
jgi:CheY-like chemotaxis protein